MALLAIPFEVYVLRKRRTWHLYASIFVLGFNGVLSVTSVMTPPEATFDPELTAAYDSADRIVAGAFQFLSIYYLMWMLAVFHGRWPDAGLPRTHAGRGQRRTGR